MLVDYTFALDDGVDWGFFDEEQPSVVVDHFLDVVDCDEVVYYLEDFEDVVVLLGWRE
jgi:hypothetical protein